MDLNEFEPILELNPHAPCVLKELLVSVIIPPGGIWSTDEAKAVWVFWFKIPLSTDAFL